MSLNINKYIKMIADQNEMWNKIPAEYYSDYNVKRGLRNSDGTGVLAGLTAIGEVHGYILDEGTKMPIDGGLRYRGIDVEDITVNCKNEGRFGFEETIFLIMFGFLPNRESLDEFSKEMAQNRTLPPNFTEDTILKSPSPDIMNKLAQSVLALYSHYENPDDLSLENLLYQSLSLIGRLPTLIAHAYQSKAYNYDQQSLIIHAPNPELSIAENFLYMIRPDNNYTKLEAEILDLMLILHAEHGGGNNSAFAARVVSSSATDLFSSLAAAIGSLKGPKHGGANNRMIKMMDEIKLNVNDWSDDKEVYEYLKKILRKEAGDGLIYGMGHAVYTLSDPRAILLKERAAELAREKGHHDEYSLYTLIEVLAPIAFAEVKNDTKVISANVDFYSGFVYQMLGIPKELFTPLFAMSRIVGWCAHILEENLTGGRIIRPAYKSIVKRSAYTPIAER